jgi:hypothetical protein
MKISRTRLAWLAASISFAACDAPRTLVQGEDNGAFFPDLRVSADVGSGPKQLEQSDPNWPLANHVVLELDVSRASGDDTQSLFSNDVIDLGGKQIHGPGNVALDWRIQRIGVDVRWGGALSERWFFAAILGLASHDIEIEARAASQSADESSNWIGFVLGGEVDLRIASGWTASLRVVNDAGGQDTHLADGEIGVEWHVPKTAFSLFAGLRKWAYATTEGINDFDLSTGGPEISLRAMF